MNEPLTQRQVTTVLALCTGSYKNATASYCRRCGICSSIVTVTLFSRILVTMALLQAKPQALGSCGRIPIATSTPLLQRSRCPRLICSSAYTSSAPVSRTSEVQASRRHLLLGAAGVLSLQQLVTAGGSQCSHNQWPSLILLAWVNLLSTVEPIDVICLNCLAFTKVPAKQMSRSRL